MDFEKPDTSVDCVLFTLAEDGLRVLLLPRDKDPFRGVPTLVGGYVRPQVDRTLDDTVQRVLRDKAGIEGVYLEQLGTFGSADRDPRGWSIAVAYFALIPNRVVEEAGERSGVTFESVGVDVLQPLPFDHAQIVAKALERIRAKAAYSTLPTFLLPERFTISQYRDVFQLVTGRKIDPGSFHRKFKELEEVRKVVVQDGKMEGPLNAAGKGTREARAFRFVGGGGPAMVDGLF
ncbi:NUDIX hydrolase [Methylorubrum extorquens]|jgi:ADP-ribose pyrophosphatase YjhB (NUDIX family)|uniref:NrtR DNA-binding winged helix domain-containing protein n=2 Tax=Methylorubrum extorquens TaxID=408 RepID=C5B5U3_METEA|nr:NUDIX hydrolase [Methylorubrum extorquens]ACS43825.1 Hypothetical protein MexAM1_META2p1042 [Methylorubrum extorquens AM1]EHP91297.1 NUDIX hydrolase [Methylorubrum extorquens DSM 13060]MCP1546330.1 ADP-ribose pyrophosphatase YjhB (NUDIX family) [Methylorubrum extorquens]MCP1590997.1 ADP-ribose pyrophosphatase YjhB (NUDIX family) [Methylorubrum extorquens]